MVYRARSATHKSSWLERRVQGAPRMGIRPSIFSRAEGSDHRGFWVRSSALERRKSEPTNHPPHSCFFGSSKRPWSARARPQLLRRPSSGSPSAKLHDYKSQPGRRT